MGARIIGCGKAVPQLVVENDELAKLVETNDEWISSRTGIERRNVSVRESTLDLALKAARQALSESGAVGLRARAAIDPATIDLIIFTTITPDSIVPCSASDLKMALGAQNAIAFDINAACTGFIYGSTVAESMMASSAPEAADSKGRNRVRRALIASSERMTRLVDWQDRNTCVLFGDGAGAVVLEWEEEEDGMLSSYLCNQDDADHVLTCPMSFDIPIPFAEDGIMSDEEARNAHIAAHPDPKEVDYSYIYDLGCMGDPASGSVSERFELDELKADDAPFQTIYMSGQKVFKFAARAMEAAVREACDRAGMLPDQLDAVIPHQANKRIIEFSAKRLDMPLEKFQLSIQDTGNTSSAGVPMALRDALEAGFAKAGDTVALVAFGGGLTYGAMIVKL